MSAVFRVAWTALVIVLVVFATRAAAPSGEASEEAVRCEIDPPHDVRALEDCVTRSPHDIELLLELGEAYEAAGQTDSAESTYRRAVAVDPHDAGVQRRLARFGR